MASSRTGGTVLSVAVAMPLSMSPAAVFDTAGVGTEVWEGTGFRTGHVKDEMSRTVYRHGSSGAGPLDLLKPFVQRPANLWKDTEDLWFFVSI